MGVTNVTWKADHRDMRKGKKECGMLHPLEQGTVGVGFFGLSIGNGIIKSERGTLFWIVLTRGTMSPSKFLGVILEAKVLR